MEQLINTMTEAKIKIINRSLIASAIIGAASYLLSLYRFFLQGFHISFLINLVIIITVIILAFMRNRLSLTFKTYVLIALILMLALADCISYGLLATTRMYLVLIPLFSIISLSLRQTIVIFSGALLTYLAIGYLHTKGIFTLPADIELTVYFKGFYPWLIRSLHYMLSATIILLVTRTFISTYSALIDELERVIKERTDDLEASNEELKATNEEIFGHREALQKALSDLQSAQDQLVHSEKMASLGVLTAGVAHEINNPLNFINSGITGIESYIKENLPDHEQALAPLVEGVQVGVKRASDIVASLGRYSREGDAEPKPLNVHVLLDNCLIMLQHELKHRITIVKQYTGNSYIFTGKEGKLHQAFLNLLINAVQAITDRGSITLSTKTTGDDLEICIADTGSGIDAEVLPRITEPFFTTHEAGKGTGLGLWITYNIVTDHKGKLRFLSQPGKGTQAIVTLPLNKKG